jgi:hypothetical protein
MLETKYLEIFMMKILKTVALKRYVRIWTSVSTLSNDKGGWLTLFE